MCSDVWRLRPDRTCSGTVGVIRVVGVVRVLHVFTFVVFFNPFGSAADDADAIADAQSVHAQYGAAAGQQIRLTSDPKHNLITAKRNLIKTEQRADG